MEKKKIPSKTRILIALILGGMSLIGGFVVSFNEPWGNTAEEIRQVEDAIGKACADMGKVIHKDEKNIMPTLREIEAEIKRRGIDPNLSSSSSGITYLEDISDGGVDRVWEKIEEITNPLVYENERIAKAKALLHFKENPTPSYSSFDNVLWTKRFDISKQDWKTQNFSSRILTSTGVGFGVFFAITIIAYLVLTIVPWLWYFLLNRISELSQAVRGK